MNLVSGSSRRTTRVPTALNHFLHNLCKNPKSTLWTVARRVATVHPHTAPPTNKQAVFAARIPVCHTCHTRPESAAARDPVFRQQQRQPALAAALCLPGPDGRNYRQATATHRHPHTAPSSEIWVSSLSPLCPAQLSSAQRSSLSAVATRCCHILPASFAVWGVGFVRNGDALPLAAVVVVAVAVAIAIAGFVYY